MTADEALVIAEKQRPGIKLVVGAVSAREELMQRIHDYDLYKLPGDVSFYHRDVKELCGFEPHPLAMFQGGVTEDLSGKKLTADDWRFLHNATYEDRLKFMNQMLKAREQDQ